MKEKIKLTGLALIALCLFSCGNNKNESAPASAGENMDNAEVATAAKQDANETAAEGITLSFTQAQDPCFGSEPDYLNIKGGKPFEDEANPYKVEAKNTEKSSIELGKFAKKDDGSFTMSIPGTMNLTDDEAFVQIVVTDAAGVQAIIDYVIPYCP